MDWRLVSEKVDFTTTEEPWYKRAHPQFSLQTAPGVGAKLLYRYCDDAGQHSDGHAAYWQPIAEFKSYNDAEMVLRLLRKAADR